MFDMVGQQNDICTAFEKELTASDVSAFQALQEMVQNLPATYIDDVAQDLEEFELTGVVSSKIESVLERALCLIHADRIAAQF